MSVYVHFVLFSMVLFLVFCFFFFFFKQKTAYEMRISDWSSDVCSSDLLLRLAQLFLALDPFDQQRQHPAQRRILLRDAELQRGKPLLEIGRASCRERVCQYV